jgi:hypothetical protein
LVIISALAPCVMSPFTMGQTIWFRCIHIYIEIVVANCTIIEVSFLEDYGIVNAKIKLPVRIISDETPVTTIPCCVVFACAIISSWSLECHDHCDWAKAFLVESRHPGASAP